MIFLFCIVFSSISSALFGGFWKFLEPSVNLVFFVYLVSVLYCSTLGEEATEDVRMDGKTRGSTIGRETIYLVQARAVLLVAPGMCTG